MQLSAIGDIITVAGDGLAGDSGDGGPAVSARLRYTNGIAVDASGDIYIADSGSSVIRKITNSSGCISTVAGFGSDGGFAQLAKLHSPQDVAFDILGNIYIADTRGSAIRKIIKDTGYISTVAGTPMNYSYSGDGALAVLAELNFLQYWLN